MNYTSLEACPKCNADSIFLPMNPAAGYDGKLYGSRSEGFCNSPECDQLLWYYPRSGRVTRRNTGPTLSDYHAKQNRWVEKLAFINSMRRMKGLPRLMVVPDRIPAEPSLLARLRLMPVEWFWWIVAALKSPFLGKLPLVDVEALQSLQSGDKTINQVREERGLDPVESDQES